VLNVKKQKDVDPSLEGVMKHSVILKQEASTSMIYHSKDNKKHGQQHGAKDY